MVALFAACLRRARAFWTRGIKGTTVPYIGGVPRQLLAGLRPALGAALAAGFIHCSKKTAPVSGVPSVASTPSASVSARVLEPPPSAVIDPPLSAADLERAVKTRQADIARLRQASYALVMGLPEWKARAADTASTPGDQLGLTCEGEPSPGSCEPSRGECRFSCEAIRVCRGGGCAGGRWLDFEVDPVRQMVSVEDAETSQYLPYGRWRNRFRTEARQARDAAYRVLTAPAQAFPEHEPGKGELGYGTPSSVSPRVSAALGEVIARGGYRLVRVETYPPNGFQSYVLLEQATPPAHEGDRRAFRSWGANLVRANADRACEIVIDHFARDPTRFQFDRFAFEQGEGGVYAFVDGAFQPWRTRVALGKP